ncbi:MAG: large-conductance mechanosensitive channel protein MscL [Bacilli bacterium]
MKEKVKSLIKEFKVFIERGNVVDLAVGVVIGSAFSKIVSSVVDDLLMPIIGIILGGLDFSNLSIKIGDSVIKYGSFINNVINFFIIAICVFILVKLINKLTKKKEAVEEETKEIQKSDEVLLLEEIRDELKKKNSKEKKK